MKWENYDMERKLHNLKLHTWKFNFTLIFTKTQFSTMKINHLIFNSPTIFVFWCVGNYVNT